MTQIQPQIGFVGFFDILGYSQIMLNNNIHKTSQFVSDTLMNIPMNLIKRQRYQREFIGPGSKALSL